MDSVLANLESHVTEHALVERATLGFRSWVDDASNDITPLLPDDGSPEQLSSELESISLCFRPAHVSYPFVDTRLSILKFGVQVGYYRSITLLDGSAVDDYFVVSDAAE